MINKIAFLQLNQLHIIEKIEIRHSIFHLSTKEHLRNYEECISLWFLFIALYAIHSAWRVAYKLIIHRFICGLLL